MEDTRLAGPTARATEEACMWGATRACAWLGFGGMNHVRPVALQCSHATQNSVRVVCGGWYEHQFFRNGTVKPLFHRVRPGDEDG